MDKKEQIKNLNKSIDKIENGICPDCNKKELLGLFLSGNNLDDVFECLECSSIFNLTEMVRDLRFIGG